MSIPLSLPLLPARFARIIMDLCFAAPRGLGRDYPAFPLLTMVRAHLRRLGARFAAIAARAQAGTLRTSPRRTAGKPAARRFSWPRPPRALPTGYMWLLKLAPWTCGGGAEIPTLVLADPEMAALIEAAPQVKRILRTILWATYTRTCEMPEILRLPARPRAPRRRFPRATVPAPATPDPDRPEAQRRGYRPSANWPKGVITRPPRRRGKLRSSTGPPRKA